MRVDWIGDRLGGGGGGSAEGEMTTHSHTHGRTETDANRLADGGWRGRRMRGDRGRKSASERADGVDSWKQGEEETDADGAGLCSIQSCVPAR